MKFEKLIPKALPSKSIEFTVSKVSLVLIPTFQLNSVLLHKFFSIDYKQFASEWEFSFLYS